METIVTVSKNVRRMREARGWTQTELADAAGLHRMTVTSIEHEGNNGCSTMTLDRLARAFGCKAIVFFVPNE